MQSTKFPLPGRRPAALVGSLFILALSVVLLTGRSAPAPGGGPAEPGGRQDVAADSLPPLYRDMIARLGATPASERMHVAACFASPVPQALVDAVEAAMRGFEDFQLGGRWTTTASGGGLAQGAPTTLTYSIVPDGTAIAGSVGEPAAPSNLIAAFNGVFPSPATWQGIIQQCFTDWGALTGVTYVFEPNDDGVQLGTSAGQLGVRGDVRIGGHFIDGSSGILAYNSFPNNGDMVIDTGDTAFFSNSSSNYVRLRNTVRHEHGHGLGMAHVCPISQTKLMEPFLATGFSGPQYDDVLGAQRHYGDDREPNDTSGAASDLGTFAATGSQTVGNTTAGMVTIDDNADVDFWKFTITGSRQVTISVAPFGSGYLQGPQNGDGSCSAGTNFDPATQNDLGVELRDQNGTTVLATANAGAAGATETISSFALANAGTYFVRVFGGTNDTAQAYQLALTIAAAPPFSLSFPNGAPTTVAANTATAVDVLATPILGTPDPASGLLFVSTGGGPFVASPLQSLGGNLFRATLPATNCFVNLRWYVSMAPLGGGVPILAPAGAPGTTNASLPTSGVLTTIFADNFQTDLGWTVTNDAALTAGAWQRAIPTGGGARGDPPTDADGSGFCYVTQNGTGDTDVDGGATNLTSPAFNLTGFPDALVSFRFWYRNDFGSNPGTDTFLIQLSANNGASWTTVETYNANVAAWLAREIRVGQFFTPTATVRLRLVAQDPAPGAVVEAGVDAVEVYVCQNTNALGACGSGSYPIGQTPVALLTINGSTGGANRRVDIPSNQIATLSLAQPATSPTPAPFLLFAWFGVPAPADATPIPPVGTMCFPPCVLAPGNPLSVLLADSFGSGLCPPIFASTPTPWSTPIPAFAFPIQFTLQGVIQQSAGVLAVTNGVIYNVLP